MTATLTHRSRSPQAALLLALLAGCRSLPAADAPVAQPKGPPKTHLLSIVGYNYTDRYIDHFEVNGQGGGNLGISTPLAGGGSQMCCVSWRDGSRLPLKVKVKWVASYCMQRRTNSDGETYNYRQPLLKITEVEFNGPVPAQPKQFEVHFYADGHLEVAMADDYSPPRLKLPSVNGERPWMVINDPPCPPDYDRPTAFDSPTLVDAATGKLLP